MEHGDGNQFNYRIPVPSLPMLPFPEGLHATIESAPAQPFQGALLESAGQKSLKHRIKSILKNRNLYTDEYKNSWKMFFRRLPSEGDILRPDEHVNVLSALIRDYGRKAEDHHEFIPVPANLEDYGEVDAIQFEGGPIEKGEFMTFRRSLPDGDKRGIRKRKKQLSDSEYSYDDMPSKNPDITIGSDDKPTNKSEIKKERTTRRKKQSSIKESVDVPHGDAQASLEDQVVKVVDVPAIKKERSRCPRNLSRAKIAIPSSTYACTSSCGTSTVGTVEVPTVDVPQDAV